MNTCKKRIHFVTWFEIRPDMAIIETFQDGIQLIRKNGFMVIVESCNIKLLFKSLKACVNSFSCS